MDKLKLGAVLLLGLMIACSTVLVALDKMPWSALATIFAPLIGGILALIDPRALTGSTSPPLAEVAAPQSGASDSA